MRLLLVLLVSLLLVGLPIMAHAAMTSGDPIDSERILLQPNTGDTIAGDDTPAVVKAGDLPELEQREFQFNYFSLSDVRYTDNSGEALFWYELRLNWLYWFPLRW